MYLEAALNIATMVSILLLVALGLAIVFGLMNILNMAHGELVTIGAFTASLVQVHSGSFWLCVVAAIIVGALVGWVLERGLIRYLYDRPMGVILATWGVSLIIQQGLLLLFGPSPQIVYTPIEGSITLFGNPYPRYRPVLIAAAVITIATTAIVMNRTRFGLELVPDTTTAVPGAIELPAVTHEAAGRSLLETLRAIAQRYDAETAAFVALQLEYAWK